MSGQNHQVDCQRRALVPLFNSGNNAAPVSVQALPVQRRYSAGTNVGRGSFETTGNRVLDIMCLTHTHTLGTIRPEDSGAMFYKKNPGHLEVWSCLGVNSLDMPRPPYWGSEENTRNIPCPITPPSHYHLQRYVIHLIRTA